MIRNFINNIFRKATVTPETKVEAPTATTAVTAEEMTYALMCRNLKVTTAAKTHTVTLCNVDQCSGYSTFDLISAFRGTGKVEFEWAMAKLFLESVQEALESGKTEADISTLFSVDMQADNSSFTADQIFDHIIKWFEIVDQSEGSMKVRLRVA